VFFLVAALICYNYNILFYLTWLFENQIKSI
jgi:hypothetical protein